MTLHLKSRGYPFRPRLLFSSFIVVGVGSPTVYYFRRGHFINPINKDTGMKWLHFSVVPEARYFLCEAFNGHFFGLHGVVGFYNLNKLNLPIGWFKELKDHRIQGWGYGAGITYGYEWVLGKHWNLEASLSAGYILFDYTKYQCEHCGKEVAKEKKNYLGPTKATLSLIYTF